MTELHGIWIRRQIQIGSDKVFSDSEGKIWCPGNACRGAEQDKSTDPLGLRRCEHDPVRSSGERSDYRGLGEPTASKTADRVPGPFFVRRRRPGGPTVRLPDPPSVESDQPPHRRQSTVEPRHPRLFVDAVDRRGATGEHQDVRWTIPEHLECNLYAIDLGVPGTWAGGHGERVAADLPPTPTCSMHPVRLSGRRWQYVFAADPAARAGLPRDVTAGAQEGPEGPSARLPRHDCLQITSECHTSAAGSQVRPGSG